MNSKRTAAFFFALAGLALLIPAAAQDKPNPEKIAGSWALEVAAGDANYYLTLDLKAAAGKLEGALSEQSGMFTNVPLTDLVWDGTRLKGTAKTPTPPDGAERPIKFDLTIKEDKCEGTVAIEEVGMSVPVTGRKK